MEVDEQLRLDARQLLAQPATAQIIAILRDDCYNSWALSDTIDKRESWHRMLYTVNEFENWLRRLADVDD